MNSANQMAEEIYGLHCDIGRLEKLVKHWKTEFINEQDYAKMMELEADKAKAENAKLRDEIKCRDELEAKLIRCIENDYGILFAWDPLRKVWLSECTDEYVTERERLDAENAKLRELVRDFDKCLDTILGLTGCKGFVILPDQELFDSLPVRMRELGVDEWTL